MGKAKIRDQGLTSLCWAFSAATIAELNRGKEAGYYTSYSPAHFGFFFYILTFFKEFSNQCLYFLIIVV